MKEFFDGINHYRFINIETDFDSFYGKVNCEVQIKCERVNGKKVKPFWHTISYIDSKKRSSPNYLYNYYSKKFTACKKEYEAFLIFDRE